MEREELNINAQDFLQLSSKIIKKTAGHYSAQSLAYLGDAVFEVLTRSSILADGSLQVGDLNKKAVKLVRATAQSEMYHVLSEVVNEEELSVLKRGRNAVSHSRAKSASVSEYRHATGVEALFGYLYIKGRIERILELFGYCREAMHKE